MMKIVLVLVIGFIIYKQVKQLKVDKIKYRWLKGESGIDKFDEDDFSKWRQKKESQKELLRDPLFWIIISIIIISFIIISVA